MVAGLGLCRGAPVAIWQLPGAMSRGAAKDSQVHSSPQLHKSFEASVPAPSTGGWTPPQGSLSSSLTPRGLLNSSDHRGFCAPSRMLAHPLYPQRTLSPFSVSFCLFYCLRVCVCVLVSQFFRRRLRHVHLQMWRCLSKRHALLRKCISKRHLLSGWSWTQPPLLLLGIQRGRLTVRDSNQLVELA